MGGEHGAQSGRLAYSRARQAAAVVVVIFTCFHLPFLVGRNSYFLSASCSNTHSGRGSPTLSAAQTT